MKWSITEARKRFAMLVEEAVREPQPVYKRGRLVAAIVDAEAFGEFLRWKDARAKRSIAEALRELGDLCETEGYSLDWGRREDRPNAFDSEPDP